MLISVIIPTYNAENNIYNLLEGLKQQSLIPFEIIIVDSQSDDKTLHIAKFFKVKIFKVRKEEFNHGGTRTLAAKLAKGDILIYLSQDVLLYDTNTINNIVSPFIKNEHIGAAFGRQIPYCNTNIFGKFLRYFNYPDEPYIREYKDKEKYGIKVTFLSNSFAAYRKKVLEKIGYFKDDVILDEDMYAGAKILKAGYKIAYVPEAKVYHSHSYTVWQEFKRYFDIGVFHRCENWILKEFGRPEKEGLSYIKSELRFLIENKSLSMIPESLLRNLMKYLGYKLGYNYTLIPQAIAKKISMHPTWWDKRRKK